MHELWPKIVRDPVHNVISFENTRCDRLLLSLVDTREFQRLRRVKQLGFSDFVFPGANHTRFSHSLGAMHVARMILERIGRLGGVRLEEDDKALVLVACLLHDIGHGPFSHAFERVSRQRHESWTQTIITDDSTEVNRRLREYDQGFPGRLVEFFFTEEEARREKGALPTFLTHIVKSQVDADRFDYLLRDSYSTGTNYGNYDLRWLIEQLLVDERKRRFYFSRKALYAAEAYVFARYHMYQSVYFHKATRAAEVMLLLVFKRFKELLDKAGRSARGKPPVPDAPPAVVRSFSGDLSLDDFRHLDDHAIMEFLKAAVSCDDEILKTLANGLVCRRLFKGTDATDAEPAAVGRFHAEVVSKIRGGELDPEYSFVADTPADTPYRPYDPDENQPATQIYVQTSTGDITEISQLSDPLKELRKRYTLLRYYYPAELRNEIDKIAKATIRREGRES